MDTIDEAELRGLDLNLLVTLSVLVREQSVTRAAQRLHLSQAAVSAALQRLRGMLRDPVLERRGRSMRPTPRALEVLEAVGPALQAVAGALLSADRFDPSAGPVTFTVGMSDDVEAALAPRLVSHLQAAHPTVTVAIRQANQHVFARMLAEREIDLAIGVAPPAADALDTQPLFESGYSCVYDAARLDLPAPLPLDDYLAAAHVLVSFSGTRGVVDDALDALGRTRRVIASSTHFASLTVSLRSVGALATIPSHAAQAFADATDFTVVAPPIDLPRYTISCLWWRPRRADPRVAWMRDLVRELFADEELSGLRPGSRDR